MSNMLNDTLDAAKSKMEYAKDGTQHALDAAKSKMEYAKDGTQHAISSARSTLIDGIHAVNGVVSILRGLQVTDALGWFGLARRRGPFGSLALFGAGVAVGTGVGMLFAPKSGAETRRALFGGLMGLEKKAEAGAKEIEEKAENLAGKAKDAVVNAEHKVEDYAGKAKEAVMGAERTVETKVDNAKETIKGKVDSAVDAAKDTADQAKSLMSSGELFRQGGETMKPADGTGNHRTTHRHS